MTDPTKELYIKREYQRYPCELPVKMVTEDGTFNGTAMNAGLGGMLVVADDDQLSFELDTTVTLCFQLPFMLHDTEIISSVRWSKANAIGFQFANLREEDGWELRQFIEDNDRLRFIKTIAKQA